MLYTHSQMRASTEHLTVYSQLVRIYHACGAVVKNLPANAGEARDAGSIPGSGRFPQRKKWPPTPGFLPAESHESPSLRGAWGVIVHGVTKSWMGLKNSLLPNSDLS